jgi:hypothetical protein
VPNPQLQRDFPITEKRVELKTDQMGELEFGTGGWPPISTWIIINLCVHSISGTEFHKVLHYAK